MLAFPQLATGAAVQYPFSKQLAQRSIRSVMEDGTVIALADRGARYLQWRLAFQGLSDLEAGSLRSFFAATQGNLLPFFFMDPTANLLLWSEDFSKSAWDKGALSLSTAVADPFGGTRASQVSNFTATDQAIGQTTQIPGSAQTCFSVYLRTASTVTALLNRAAGSQSVTTRVTVTKNWTRFSLSGAFPGTTEVSRFAVTVPAGSTIEIFGPQVDAQPNPSPYLVSEGNMPSVYTTARFDMKELELIATGPDRNACVVYIRYNLPAGE